MTNQEQIEDRQIREGLKVSIEQGKQLDRLKTNPDFNAIIGGVFIKTGLDILWQNVRHLKEEQLKGRGSDKNLEILGLLDGQIKSRLDFDGFLDTVENDAINAKEALEEMDAEAEVATIPEGA